MVIDTSFKARKLNLNDLICVVRQCPVGNALLQKDTILIVQDDEPCEIRDLSTKVNDLGGCSLLQTPYRFRTIYKNEIKRWLKD